MSDGDNPGRLAGGVYQLAPFSDWPVLTDQTDALAAPDAAVLAPTLAAVLPLGAAWRSPDGAAFDDRSRLGGLLRALAGALGLLYRRVFRVGQESTASTLVDSLEDWEAEYGLPDPCLGESQTLTQRQRALLLRVRSAATLTPGDFIRLAAGLGYEITISEPRPFATGFSWCGGPDGTGSAAQFFWVVHVRGVASKRFETGASRTGLDSLLDIARPVDLECVFRAIAPAWTRVIFDYS